MTKSRGIIKNRQRWTDEQLAILRREYPNRMCAAVACLVGHTVSSTYQYARRLGLEKSADFNASPASGRLQPNDARGVSGRFRPGNPSWNKGTHWKAGGRSPLTRFKPGQMPHNRKPIGAERISKDGIRQRKVTETGYPPRDWKSVHVILWEETHGPVPPGHIVVFRDGNRERIQLDNLELVSRQGLMRRNTVHNYPQPIPQLVQLRGAITRQINKRERHAKQD